jgi:hypothetical protein
MRRRDKAVKTQHRKTLKSRNTARVARHRKPSAVDAYEKIARLEHRLKDTGAAGSDFGGAAGHL